jgi:hypothetical protein
MSFHCVSRRPKPKVLFLLAGLSLLGDLSSAWAQPAPLTPGAPPPAPSGAPQNGPPASNGSGGDRTQISEEEDFSGTPFTEYGEFNEEEEEAADTRFFQTGRFFGLSIGGGAEGALGNRGVLWQGGIPALSFKVHYWFDFNLAMDLSVGSSNHFYEILDDEEHVDIRFNHFGSAVKYYFNTRNISSAVSFASPYILAGFASYTKTEASTLEETVDAPETRIGLNAGGGLEFVLKHRKAYVQIEGRLHMVSFTDTYSPRFSESIGIPDVTGAFYTTTVSVMFTW